MHICVTEPIKFIETPGISLPFVNPSDPPMAFQSCRTVSLSDAAQRPKRHKRRGRERRFIWRFPLQCRSERERRETLRVWPESVSKIERDVSELMISFGLMTVLIRKD
jgi:hypothetical protein